MKKISKGFTMIELLIVISVLGVLAVAVLSAINPIEQINRSRDTGSRSDAEQLISAIDRFYASNGFYPWQEAEDNDTLANVWMAVDDTWVDTADASVLDKISGDSGTAEVKESFINRITATTYNPLYVFNGGTQGDSTYVCFSPRSSNFVTEATTRCNSGDLPADYPGGACNNTDDCGATNGSCICLP